MTKKAFYICLLFFIVLEAYGIYFYELRTQWETCQDTIWACMGHISIPTPMFRYAHILNKVFFVLSFPLHFSFTSIAILCNVNDALFYLTVAVLIIWLTHRYDYAATVLAAPVLLHIFAYYDIINETFPGGSMLILFVALHKHMEDKPWLKNVLLATSMFFVIWGHPDMLITLFVFIPFIFSDVQQVKRHWKTVAFILLNVVLRMILLSGYDMGKINLVNASSFFIHNLIGKGWAYLQEYWFIAVVVACLAYIIYKTPNRIIFSGLLALPVMLAYVDAYHTNLHISISDPNVLKYLYPLHLFALLHTMIFIHALPALKLRWYMVGMVILLVAGLQKTLSYHAMMVERAETIKKLNVLCALQDTSQSKWYMQISQIPALANATFDESNEGLVFSVRSHQLPNIHLVWATDETVAKLDTVPDDKLFANGGMEFPINSFDTFYLHIKPGRYKKLIVDSVALRYLNLK